MYKKATNNKGKDIYIYIYKNYQEQGAIRATNLEATTTECFQKDEQKPSVPTFHEKL